MALQKPPDDLGARLKDARNYGQLSVRQLRNELVHAGITRGASEARIKQWENGSKPLDAPSAQTIINEVSRLTTVPAEYLWGHDEAWPHRPFRSRDASPQDPGALSALEARDQLDRIEDAVVSLTERLVRARVIDAVESEEPNSLPARTQDRVERQ